MVVSLGVSCVLLNIKRKFGHFINETRITKHYQQLPTSFSRIGYAMSSSRLDILFLPKSHWNIWWNCGTIKMEDVPLPIFQWHTSREEGKWTPMFRWIELTPPSRDMRGEIFSWSAIESIWWNPIWKRTISLNGVKEYPRNPRFPEEMPINPQLSHNSTVYNIKV